MDQLGLVPEKLCQSLGGGKAIIHKILQEPNCIQTRKHTRSRPGFRQKSIQNASKINNSKHQSNLYKKQKKNKQNEGPLLLRIEINRKAMAALFLSCRSKYFETLSELEKSDLLKLLAKAVHLNIPEDGLLHHCAILSLAQIIFSIDNKELNIGTSWITHVLKAFCFIITKIIFERDNQESIRNKNAGKKAKNKSSFSKENWEDKLMTQLNTSRILDISLRALAHILSMSFLYKEDSILILFCERKSYEGSSCILAMTKILNNQNTKKECKNLSTHILRRLCKHLIVTEKKNKYVDTKQCDTIREAFVESGFVKYVIARSFPKHSNNIRTSLGMTDILLILLQWEVLTYISDMSSQKVPMFSLKHLKDFFEKAIDYIAFSAKHNSNHLSLPSLKISIRCLVSIIKLIDIRGSKHSTSHSIRKARRTGIKDIKKSKDSFLLNEVMVSHLSSSGALIIMIWLLAHSDQNIANDASLIMRTILLYECSVPEISMKNVVDEKHWTVKLIQEGALPILYGICENKDKLNQNTKAADLARALIKKIRMKFFLTSNSESFETSWIFASLTQESCYRGQSIIHASILLLSDEKECMYDEKDSFRSKVIDKRRNTNIGKVSNVFPFECMNLKSLLKTFSSTNILLNLRYKECFRSDNSKKTYSTNNRAKMDTSDPFYSDQNFLSIWIESEDILERTQMECPSLHEIRNEAPLLAEKILEQSYNDNTREEKHVTIRCSSYRAFEVFLFHLSTAKPMPNSYTDLPEQYSFEFVLELLVISHQYNVQRLLEFYKELIFCHEDLSQWNSFKILKIGIEMKNIWLCIYSMRYIIKCLENEKNCFISCEPNKARKMKLVRCVMQQLFSVLS